MPTKQILIIIFFLPVFLFSQDSISEIKKDTIAVQSKKTVREIVSAPIVLKGDTIFYVRSWSDTYPVEILSPGYISARDGKLSTVPSQRKNNDISPVSNLVDHLTGRNQKIAINKQMNLNLKIRSITNLKSKLTKT